jgi:hypothetical protein
MNKKQALEDIAIKRKLEAELKKAILENYSLNTDFIIFL